MFQVKSYAKINLMLEVSGKRADGYHEINTIFHEIELHDEMSFSPSDTVRVSFVDAQGKDSALHRSNIEISEIRPEDNLVTKAALLIKDRYQVQAGIDVKIRKNIPISAGLAGGSSNAAATIKALSSIWELDLNDSEMTEIASSMGSDVVFFLKGKTALGQGRGEIITTLCHPYISNILLVKPDIGITSSSAYSLFDAESKNNVPMLERNPDTGYILNDPVLFHNDLEPAIRIKYPDVEAIISYMNSDINNCPIKAMLSGSGSTVIGFYDDEEKLERHNRYFSEKGYWSRKTHTRQI